MRVRKATIGLTGIAAALVLAACGSSSSNSDSSSSKSSGGSPATKEGTPQRGGSITIARIEDSQSFDKTTVFQNESIWLVEQINESLYTVGPDGKTLKPWLATSYMKSADGKKYTFKLRPGVKFPA